MLLIPFARIHRDRFKITNQRQEECLTECQSLLVHTLWTAPLPCICSHSVKLNIFSEGLQELCKCKADKQPPAMKRLPICPLPTTAYITKTSKQKKTNGEKQAKKKELDRDRVNTWVNIGGSYGT